MERNMEHIEVMLASTNASVSAIATRAIDELNEIRSEAANGHNHSIVHGEAAAEGGARSMRDVVIRAAMCLEEAHAKLITACALPVLATMDIENPDYALLLNALAETVGEEERVVDEIVRLRKSLGVDNDGEDPEDWREGTVGAAAVGSPEEAADEE